MTPLLEELKSLMELHGLSPAEVSKYIGVSEKTGYNWLRYETSSPNSIYQERIRRAIRKIRREYETGSVGQEISRHYRAVWPKLSRKEKDELLELVSQSGGALQPAYLEKLKALAEKHNIKVSK